jgi:hypothetical protein
VDQPDSAIGAPYPAISVDVYFTTVCRGAPLSRGGSLVRLDWDARRVVRSVRIAPWSPIPEDPNPGGTTRGGRGIVRIGPHLVTGSFDTLLRFTSDLELVDGTTHPLLAGTHQLEVAPGEDSVWAAATNIDAALLLRLGTGELLDERWPRELPGLQEDLGLRPLVIDKAADQRGAFLSHKVLHEPGRVHLNAVRLHDGRLLGLLNRQGAIVDLDSGRVVVRHRSIVGGHDLVPTPGGSVVVSDTVRGRVLTFDLATGRLTGTIDLRKFPWVRRLEGSAHRPSLFERGLRRVVRRPALSKPLFVRGLVRHEGSLFVGVSPAAILEIDERSGALLGAYQHSGDVNECVHGLYVWA